MACALFALTTAASAQVNFSLPGSAEMEAWDDMTATTLPSYPGFPGFDAWPAPIAPTEPGSAGNAVFNKLGGGGYPGTQSIYLFTADGTFSIANNNPLPGLETVVLQQELGIGDPGFYTSAPVLSLNGNSIVLPANFTAQFDGPTNFTNPFDGSDDSTQVFAYQWDLSGVSVPVSDYALIWTNNPHATIHSLQLDSGDAFTMVIPEPGTTVAILGVAALLFVAFNRLRRR